MTRLLILVVAAALAIALVTTAVAATPRVYYRTPFGKVVSKPKRIEFSDLTLSKIHWKHWGRKTTRGTGRARTDASGTATLRMFKRHKVGHKRFYGCMTGTTTINGRSEHVEWPAGCAG
jgi:hypothetical protein